MPRIWTPVEPTSHKKTDVPRNMIWKRGFPCASDPRFLKTQTNWSTQRKARSARPFVSQSSTRTVSVVQRSCNYCPMVCVVAQSTLHSKKPRVPSPFPCFPQFTSASTENATVPLVATQGARPSMFTAFSFWDSHLPSRHQRHRTDYLNLFREIEDSFGSLGHPSLLTTFRHSSTRVLRGSCSRLHF